MGNSSPWRYGLLALPVEPKDYVNVSHTSQNVFVQCMLFKVGAGLKSTSRMSQHALQIWQMLDALSMTGRPGLILTIFWCESEGHPQLQIPRMFSGFSLTTGASECSRQGCRGECYAAWAQGQRWGGLVVWLALWSSGWWRSRRRWRVL